MSYGLGVDLGTSFTRAATSRGGQVRMAALSDSSTLMPSVVMVSDDGGLTAGELGLPDDDPTRIGRDFKRRLGDPTPLILKGQPHSAVSLLATTLKSVITTLTAAEGEPPDEVVLTCPAVWGLYRREHFIEVPRQAGLSNVTVLTEPEAAATDYAARNELAENDVVAVYDLGGGTFDTAVARKTGTGVDIIGIPEGVEWVGGIDFDEAVLAHVDREVGGAISALDPADPVSATALRQVREECVRAKERLSTEDSTNIRITLLNRRTEVHLTRAQFEGMITPALEATLAALRRAVDSASLTPKELAGVLVVGGSSRIPLVSRMLSQDLGRPILVDPNPQHCVALGAATIAGNRLTAESAVTTMPRIQRPSRRTIVATTAAALLIGAGGYVLDEMVRPVVPAKDGTDVAGPTPGEPRTVPQSPAPKPVPLPLTKVVVAIDGRCLDADARANDTPNDALGEAQQLSPAVRLSACDDSRPQSWNLRTDDTFRTLNKCLQVATGTNGPPPLDLQDCTAEDDQRWRMQGKAITNVGSGLCLEVNTTAAGRRIPLTVRTCTARPNQEWALADPPKAS